MYVQRNNEARSCNHSCSGKTIIITYSECVFVDLFSQHAKRMRRVILSVGYPVVQNFSTLPHNRRDFQGKVFGTQNAFLEFPYNCVRNISRSKKNSAIYYHICTLVLM
jgi:hypothetical protein